LLLSVHLSNTFDADDARVLSITIDWEAMADTIDTHVAWNTAKTIDWETSVEVIRFNDLADHVDSCLVLIICAEEM